MSKSAKSTPPKNFEAAVSELEGLVAAMEAGNLTLEDSLAAYKRGMELTVLRPEAYALPESLLAEAKELTAIVTVSIRTARNNQEKKRKQT